MSSKTDGLMKRWQSQRWLLDAVIEKHGIDWDQPRSFYMAAPAGPEAMAVFRGVGSQIKRIADFDREFAKAARRREERARRYEVNGQTVAARENYLIAALLWATARWPIFEINDTLVAYEDHMNACYASFATLSAHPVEIVKIPFNGKELPAYLHLPYKPGKNETFPCVINIPGMDSSKENGVAMYGDPLLQRGIAVLSVDGPGQGECCTLGIQVSERNHMDAAQVIYDWITRHPSLDAKRVALKGTSFGSFFGTQAAAALKDKIKGTAVVAVCHEPGCNTIFNMASPSFKLRFMFMSGYEDEEAFDDFAQKLDLRPVVQDITAPYLVVAGEDDQLSPIEHTYALFDMIKAPKKLVVYQGANHAISDGMAVKLGENRNVIISDWLADRLNDKPMDSEKVLIDATGNAHTETL